LHPHPSLPLRLEGLHLRRRKIAMLGPAARERQPAESPEELAGEAEPEDRERRGDPVETRPPREPRPEGKSAADGCGL